MKLNEKIAFYRRKLGYSQQTLADAMSVSRQSVSKWETGESLPEVTKLPQLAALFGVTTDFLLSEDAPAEDSAPPKPEKSAEVEDFSPENHAESGSSTADCVPCRMRSKESSTACRTFWESSFGSTAGWRDFALPFWA